MCLPFMILETVPGAENITCITPMVKPVSFKNWESNPSKTSLPSTKFCKGRFIISSAISPNIPSNPTLFPRLFINWPVPVNPFLLKYLDTIVLRNHSGSFSTSFLINFPSFGNPAPSLSVKYSKKLTPKALAKALSKASTS